MTVEYLGNQELLQLRKTAFLASSTISSETVLQVYDWATEMRNRGACVDTIWQEGICFVLLSTFHNFGRNLKLSLFIGGLGNSAIFGVTYWKTSDFRILPRYAYC